MLTKLKVLYARVKAALTRVRSTVAVVAGVAAYFIANGTAHGVALHIAEGVIGLTTILGVHVTAKKAAK